MDEPERGAHDQDEEQERGEPRHRVAFEKRGGPGVEARHHPIGGERGGARLVREERVEADADDPGRSELEEKDRNREQQGERHLRAKGRHIAPQTPDQAGVVGLAEGLFFLEYGVTEPCAGALGARVAGAHSRSSRSWRSASRSSS